MLSNSRWEILAFKEDLEGEIIFNISKIRILELFSVKNGGARPFEYATAIL